MSGCRSRSRSRGTAPPSIGFDIDATRIAELKAGRDRTREVEPADLRHPSLRLTCDPAALAAADFFIVTVPTPIDKARRPDLTALLAASRTVGKALKQGDIVVYESTVYPGATEEDCVPVLEQASGLTGGRDFTVGYSPERINPGDKAHRFETIKKVVAGQDARTLDIVADGLRLGRHRRPAQGAVDQGGGSRQGDRELAARSQHRVHERAVGDLSPARHRHQGRAGGGRDQVEFPQLHARAWSAATASASIRII